MLYYLDQEDLKKEVLSEIKNKGSKNCVFAFSVVTGRAGSRYFGYAEAQNFFGSQFRLIHTIKLTLDEKMSLRKIIRKFIELFSIKIALDLYLKELRSIHVEDAYQTLFICKKFDGRRG
jgi:hypothetical protein